MSNIGLLPQRYELYLEYATKMRKLFLALQCCNKEYNNRKCRRIINSIYHNVSRVTIPYPTPMMVEGAYCNVATCNTLRMIGI